MELSLSPLLTEEFERWFQDYSSNVTAELAILSVYLPVFLSSKPNLSRFIEIFDFLL